MEEFDWFVGIDWGSRTHRACLMDATGNVAGERDIAHSGAGLGEFFDWLLVRTGAAAERIAVAIEAPHGPVVEGALERGFAVYSINPKQLDRFRDRFSIAGAKDDARDAMVAADSLRTDRRAFRRLIADEAGVIELREWSRIAEDLQHERNRLTNRMREQLWRYYPQALELTDDLGAEWFLAIWELMPRPDRVKKSRKPAIARILAGHRIRRIAAGEVLQILRERPLSVSPGAVAAALAHIETLIVRLRVINTQLKQARARLDDLCARIAAQENEPGQDCEQHDATILQSLPGIGRINLAVLLAEASQPLKGRDYAALRALCGVAPVTKRSGKSCYVVRRQACNRRLREAVYHWARVAVQHDPVSRLSYARLRSRGHNHARALRTVGDRLLGLACTMLRRQTVYDPARRQIGDTA